MHELSIMENVLEIVIDFSKKNHANKVKKINLVVGSLSGIIPHWAELFFQMISRDSIAEHATLSFDIIPARIICRDCGASTEFTNVNMVFHCSYCGSDEVGLVSGKEFLVDSIEVIMDTTDMT